MGCCGGKRQQSQMLGHVAPSPKVLDRSSAQPSNGRQFVTCFEYTGGTGMTVIGPATGKRYRFDRPGARVFVDLHDRSGLVSTPHLREVRL